MSILASREHTCIHPKVSLSKDKNEECKKLLEYDDVRDFLFVSMYGHMYEAGNE